MIPDLSHLSAPAPLDPQRIRIKICGITSLKDGLMAIDAGADFLGFIFVSQSPRHLTIEKAREIAPLLGQAKRVGVFQNPTLEEIEAVLAYVPLDYIQLHGAETAAFRARLPLPVIQFSALTDSPEWQIPLTKPKNSPEQSDTSPATYLLEPPKGSGQSTADWLSKNPEEAQVLQALSETMPLFLAGGLTSGNIEAFLRQLRPFAVDTASGVEASPGVKDPDKLVAFCARVRQFQADFLRAHPAWRSPLL